MQNKPRKICIDCRMINMSGIGTYIKELIIYFIKDKFFDVICLGRKDEISCFTWFDEVSFVEINASIFSIREQVELSLKIPDCDVFWSPQYNIPLFKIRAKKRLVTIHDVYQMHNYTNLPFLAKIYVKFMLKMALKKSDEIITVSKFSKDELMKYFSIKPCKIKVIYNGINRDFNVIKNNSFNIPVQKYILFVGNIKPHKNVKNLIKAFKMLSSEIEDIALIIVGKKEGFYTGENNLSDLIDNDKDNIHFTGYISDDELKHYYKNAEIYAFPSLYEGFGLPILEAMSFSINIVASDIPPFKEIGRGDIKYFNPNDIFDMENEIKKSLNSKKEINYDDCLNRFTWSKSYKKHSKIINSLNCK